MPGGAPWGVPAATRSVFVTVGTTSFEALIATARSPPALQVLQSRGYQKLVLQVGRGALQEPPPSSSGSGSSSSEAVEVEEFRFKDSLAEDVQSADLVISHAGAGSCLETLEKGKPLIVVINDKLMNNYQLELAKQLHRDGYVLCCNCTYGAAVAGLAGQVLSTFTLCYCRIDTLVETLQLMDLSTLKPFPPGQPEKFALFLDKVVGFP